jgi:hypothetical protein
LAKLFPFPIPPDLTGDGLEKTDPLSAAPSTMKPILGASSGWPTYFPTTKLRQVSWRECSKSINNANVCDITTSP